MADGQDSERWSAAHYAANAGFVPALGQTLIDLLAPLPGERVLDLGCGDGVLTEALVARGATVVAVDGSADMVRAACARGLDARRMDGQALSFDACFDAVFSNAALHWMPDARAVLRGVAAALRPGGRFVAEFGGKGNVASIATALRASLRARGLAPEAAQGWYFPSAERYAALLEEAGFVVETITLTPRPTLLPGGMRGWLETFAGPFLANVSLQYPGEADAALAAMLAEVESLLAPALRDEQGVWTADYVRLRFRAVLR